ncbi:DUF1566 domain-containing protein [Photobacterium damselae]|uniref:Lcl C-terminal domain-containing protein n=1 Tax=Photobacterium damselae TaxID=38293 RepID=UPI001076A357|nr:DUF1566 domain-containing protein [Photobacterium damselae]MBE8127779.1 DUF1566 domain-containing protein [Photobacterium damselae subsp. piscicida]TLS85776.1 DUF1566 domain-containing protein [Photobacterium damselae subsp. damselae]WIH21799.1 DUF1566 domain-containing protein [Photobacterium damselae]
MIKRNLKIALAMAIILPAHAMASECNPAIPTSFEEGQFVDNHDGTVDDITNNLRWSKCAYGQEYNKTTNSCSGDYIGVSTLVEAADAATKFNITFEQKDCTDKGGCWHIPNIKELASLVERQCHTPSVHEVFKDTPPKPFLTNTPDVTAYDESYINDILFFTDKNGNHGGRLHVINFKDGSQRLSNVDFGNIAIRFVRPIPDRTTE